MKKRTIAVLATMLGLVVLVAAPTTSAKVGGSNGQIAFDRNSGEALLIINADGSGETKLFDSACCPKWSPDGTRLVVPALTDDGRFTSATFNPDGSGFVLLPLDEPGLNADGGVWSPDAAWLAVSGWDDNNPSRNGLYLRLSSGAGTLQRLATNPYGGRDQIGDFAPDGSSVVFLRNNPSRKGGALFVVKTDGSDVRQITPWGMAGCCTASWSPDGQWLLFDARGKLYVVHPDGTGLKQIRFHPGGRYFAFEPAWSPDGKRMVFSMYVFDLGQDDIYTANADGSDLFQVTNTPEHEGQADWGVHQP